jgi:hypothetical protein
VSQHSNYTKFILIAFGIKDDGINRQDKIFAASKLQIYLTLSRGKWVDFIGKNQLLKAICSTQTNSN